MMIMEAKMITGSSSDDHPTGKDITEAVELINNHPFIGRGKTVNSLLQGLYRLGMGRSTLYSVAGEPGIGKTRLCRELVLKGEQIGIPVLTGSCYEESAASFVPWREIFASYAGRYSLEKLLKITGGEPEDLHPLLPGQIPPPKNERQDPRNTQELLFQAVCSFFQNLPEDEPLIVIFEDLHWASVETTRLLTRVIPRLKNTPVMLIETHRTTEPEAEGNLSRITAALTKEPCFVDITLSGLAPEEGELLLKTISETALKDGQAQMIQQWTGGNPLYLTESARILRENRRENLPVSRGISALINRRLARLSGAAREIAESAAVFGSVISWELIESRVRSGTSEPYSPQKAADALEELIRRELMEEVPNSVLEYRFVHALYRDTILASIPEIRKKREHVRWVTLLKEKSSPDRDLEPLSFHAAAALSLLSVNEAGKITLKAARESFDNVSITQALTIIDHFFAAAEKYLHSLDLTLSAGLHNLAGIICRELDYCERALSEMTTAYDLWIDAGKPEKAINAALTKMPEKVSQKMWVGGMAHSALLQRAKPLIKEGTPEYIKMLIQSSDREDWNRAVELAEETQDEKLLLYVLSQYGYYMMLNHNVEESQKYISRAVPLAKKLNDPDTLYLCYYTEYWIQIRLGKNLDETGIIDALDETARKIRSVHKWYRVMGFRSAWASVTGNWDASRKGTDTFFSADHGLEDTLIRSDFMVVRECVKQETEPGFINSDEYPLPDTRLLLRDFMDPESNTWKPDTRRMRQLQKSPPRSGPPRVFALGPPIYLTRAALRIRDIPLLRDCLEELEQKAGVFWIYRCGYMGMPPDNLIGEIYTVLGNTEKAVSWHERGAEMCRRSGRVTNLGWSLWDLAQALGKQNRSGAAEYRTRVLDEAEEIARKFGMVNLMSKIKESKETELPQPDSAGNLTAREIEVLQFISKGYTNSEIAAFLHLSKHTIARHTHNVLVKTGTANRSEAVRYAVEHGLTGA